MQRETLLIIGGLFGGFLILGLIGDAVGATMFWFPFWVLFNPITLIILVIVFFVRRNQQQQQQVVIYMDGQPTGDEKVRCPDCQHVSASYAQFCGECGRSLGRPTAQA